MCDLSRQGIRSYLCINICAIRGAVRSGHKPSVGFGGSVDCQLAFLLQVGVSGASGSSALVSQTLESLGLGSVQILNVN